MNDWNNVRQLDSEEEYIIRRVALLTERFTVAARQKMILNEKRNF
jgi:hypothetical protein